MSGNLGIGENTWGMQNRETSGGWQIKQGSCLNCGLGAKTTSSTGKCEHCQQELLQQAWRPSLEKTEPSDVGLHEAQLKAQELFDYTRALEIAAARLKIAMMFEAERIPEILLEMSSIFRSLGDNVRCEAYVDRALTMFREEGQSQGVAKASAVLVKVRQEQDNLSQGLDRCEEALQELANYGDKSSQSVIELTMAHLYETTGFYAQAHEIYRKIASKSSGPRSRMQSLLGLGRSLTALGEYQMAFECYENALGLANQPGLGEFRFHVGIGQTNLSLAVRDLPLASQCLHWTQSQTSKIDGAQKVDFLLLQGRQALIANNLEQADRLFQQAFERSVGLHVSASVSWSRYWLAKVRRAQGKLEESRSIARDVLKKSHARDLRELSVWAATLVVDLERHLPMTDEWEGMILEAHAKAKELRIPEILWRTSLCMAYLSESRGEADMERRYLGQALNLLDEMRQKCEEFGRAEFFYTDDEKMRLYQHWARRMLDWNLRPQLEKVVRDCEEPELINVLKTVLLAN